MMIRLKYTKNLNEYIHCPKTNASLMAVDGGLQIDLEYTAAFGMGEKYDSFNQKGNRVVNRVEERFCFQGSKTYCPAPFFWTDAGFGMYVDTYVPSTFDFREKCIRVELPVNAEIVCFSGTPEIILREYMDLFGKALLPPEWVFGVWISANRWNSRERLFVELDKLERYDFPASVAVLEAWSDEATFYIFNGAKYVPSRDGKALGYEDFDFSESPWGDPKEMIRQLHDQNLKLLLWQIPVYKEIPPEEPYNEQNALDKREAVERGLCVRNSDGSPYRIPEGHWFSGSMIPDYTNQIARQSWFSKRQYLLDIGVDGFKTDGGEFIYRDDVRFADGGDGVDGVNKYAQDYTCAYRDFIGKDRALFSRAGYAGQHTVPIHWAGDQQSQNCELRAVLNAALSAAASGILFWSFDIAGFAGPLPSLDLYRRATQFACFCPIMQWHSEPDGGQFKNLMQGSSGNNERSPWNMADVYQRPEFLDEMRFWHKLREQLRPYLWHTAQRCVAESAPMLRPLCYGWQDDSNAVLCDDQFMLGDALLVAPMLTENAESRDVYLPDGSWVNLFTGERFSGMQRLLCGTKDRLPVFVNMKCEPEILENLQKLCPVEQ